MGGLCGHSVLPRSVGEQSIQCRFYEPVMPAEAGINVFRLRC